jgi:hypothetical protein
MMRNAISQNGRDEADVFVQRFAMWNADPAE